MQKLKERAAYLKGLMEGLEIGDSKEGKVLKAMYDLLEDLCDTVADMDDDLDQVYDELDAMDEDMDDLEEAVFGDDEDDEEEDDEDEEVEAEYELTCPNCGAVTVVDEDTLLNEQVCAATAAPSSRLNSASAARTASAATAPRRTSNPLIAGSNK